MYGVPGRVSAALQPRMVNMKRRLICALWCVLAAGCTSSAPPQSSPSATHAALVPGAALEELLIDVPAIRDRPWKTPPKLVPLDISSLTPSSSLPTSALGPLLGLDLTPAPWPLDSLAVVNGGQVHYASRHSDARALERAVFFATAQALDAQYAPAGAARADALAQGVRARASALFALSLWELRKDHPTLSMQTLAQRPELVHQADTWVSGVLARRDASWGTHLNAGQARLGLGLASAMARAQGWSGVELLQAQAPRMFWG